MRFLSVQDAREAGARTGYGVFDQGCRDACKSTIVGIQYRGEKGNCYAKKTGKRFNLLIMRNISSKKYM